MNLKKGQRSMEENMEQTVAQFVGEVRLEGGRPSMCALADASFGGGRGNFWVVEDGEYVAWLENTFDFCVVICRGFSSKRKALRLEFVKGNTWGVYASGTVMEVPCSHIKAINHYHPHGLRLVRESRVKASRISAKLGFNKHLINELEEALHQQHSQHIADLIGANNLANIKTLLSLYIQLCRAVNKGGVAAYRVPCPSKAEAKQALVKHLKTVEFKGQA